jgi:hypothetical protein
MRIPADAVIAAEKLTRYLLRPRPWDDKSGFLGQVGFSTENPAELETAIRAMTVAHDAIEDGINEYGTFYRVDGDIDGPDGRSLQVVLIWLQWKLDGTFHFVTLKPRKIKL